MRTVIFVMSMLAGEATVQQPNPDVTAKALERMARDAYLLGLNCGLNKNNSVEYCTKHFDEIWKDTAPK